MKNYVDFTITWHSSYFYLGVAGILTILIFLAFWGKRMRGIKPLTTKVILITMGSYMIFHELIFDVYSMMSMMDNNSPVVIGNITYDHGVGSVILSHFIMGNLELCRFNMYAVGIGLILFAFNNNFLKWVAATAFFGGISTLVDHWKDGQAASIHSILTHGVFLSLFPAIAFAIKNAQYRKRDIIGAFAFNLTLTAIIITLNQTMGTSMAELSTHDLEGNVVVGSLTKAWAPLGFMGWIALVIIVQLIWVVFHRSIWKLQNKNLIEAKGFLNDRLLDI